MNFLLKGAICSGLPSVGRHLGGDVPTSPGWVTDSVFGLIQLCHLGCPASWEETLPQVHSPCNPPRALQWGTWRSPGEYEAPPFITRDQGDRRGCGLFLTKGTRERESREAGKETKGRSKSARKDGGEACRGSWLKKKKGKQMKGGKRERPAKKEGRKKKEEKQSLSHFHEPCLRVWRDRPLSWDLSFSVLSLRPVPWLQEDSGPGERAPRSLKGQNGWEPGLRSLTGARAGVGPSLLLLGTVSLEHSALVSEHEGPAQICRRSRRETPGCLHTAWLSARRTCCGSLGAPENGGTRGHYFPALFPDTVQDSTRNQGSCSNLPS